MSTGIKFLIHVAVHVLAFFDRDHGEDEKAPWSMYDHDYNIFGAGEEFKAQDGSDDEEMDSGIIIPEGEAGNTMGWSFRVLEASRPLLCEKSSRCLDLVRGR